MGDISELRGLVVVISFMSCLVLLMILIPSEFYTAESMRQIDVPDYWEGINIQNYKDTWNYTQIKTYQHDFDIGGRNLQWASQQSYDYIVLRHLFGIGLMQWEGGTWYNRKGIKVSYISDFPNDQQIGASQLDDDYTEYKNIQFTVKFEVIQFQVGVHFSFNETYGKPSIAWANDKLNVLVGINFDNISTSYNAWDLIAMLLFFQLPSVHWIINALIAAPIWACVAYLAYVLIIKVIPLIAGG